MRDGALSDIGPVCMCVNIRIDCSEEEHVIASKGCLE